MKFRIHYSGRTVEGNDWDDSFEVEGESISEIKEKVQTFIKTHYLDEDKNNFWSEEL